MAMAITESDCWSGPFGGLGLLLTTVITPRPCTYWSELTGHACAACCGLSGAVRGAPDQAQQRLVTLAIDPPEALN
jgi:hypothetical protein